MRRGTEPRFSPAWVRRSCRSASYLAERRAWHRTYRPHPIRRRASRSTALGRLPRRRFPSNRRSIHHPVLEYCYDPPGGTFILVHPSSDTSSTAITFLTSTLLYDTERKVRDPGTLDHPCTLELYRRRSQMVEQPYTPSEKDRHKVDGDFVEKSGPQTLLHDARGAYGDALVARYGLRLFDRALDAIRDERERRSFVNPFLWDRVGDDEGGNAKGRITTPPVRDVERPPSRDERPHRPFHLRQELGALRRDPEHHLGTRHAVFGVAAGIPPEETLPAFARRPLGTIFRPGDEGVQRHSESHTNLSHARSPFELPASFRQRSRSRSPRPVRRPRNRR